MNPTKHKALAILGFDPAALEGMPPAERLEAVVYRLGSIIDPAERLALAYELFGQIGVEVASAVNLSDGLHVHLDSSTYAACQRKLSE